MSRTLIIKQPNIFKGRYEIYADDKLLASLQAKGLLKRKALVTIEDQRWRFVLQNPFGRNIVASLSAAGSPSAIFKTDLLRSNGSAQINGKKYFYKRIINKASATKTKPVANAWFNENEEAIITLYFNSLVRREGEAIVSDEVIASSDYLLLILLALFRFRVEYSRNM